MNKPKFQVGDRVWHPEYGWIKVHDYDPSAKTTHAYWCYIDSLKYNRWFGWWELFYDEVELPNPPKPEPGIDWSKVPQGTPVEVDNDPEFINPRKRKFIGYFVKQNPHEPFMVTEMFKAAACWGYCRLAPEVEVKEEWLK